MLVEFLSTNFTAILIFVVVFLLVWRTVRGSNNLNLPPGPRPWPLIGNLATLFRGDPRDNLEKLREKYGDVYSLYLGSSLTVFVHGYKNVKDVLVTRGDEFINRPENLPIVAAAEGKGIIFSSGRGWQEQRRFTLHALRDFGFGRSTLQGKIQEEVSVLLQCIENEGGKPFDLHPLTKISVSNVICSIVFGKRFDHDDPIFKEYLEILEEKFKSEGIAAILNFIPILKYIPGDPFKFQKNLKKAEKLPAFISNSIKAHKETFDPNNLRDFIDAYLKEMEQRQREDPDTTLNEDQLTHVVGDLFVAGSESTATTIQWAVLYLISYPDIQEKIRNEIDAVVGGNRLPSVEDRPNLPFTEATFMEVMRHSDIATGGHAPVKDTILCGYNIPKGTTVMPCFHCALHDQETWGDPQVFRPSRFLDEEGKPTKPEAFIPFSAGKRACPGESLAKMDIFLFLAAVLQRFKLEIPDGAPQPDMTAIVGITRMPRPFRLCANLRQ